MTFKIWHKLALLLIITTGLTLVLGIGLSQQSFKSGFLNYLQQQELRQLEIISEHLLRMYHEQGNWEFIRANQPLWHSILRTLPRPRPHKMHDPFWPGNQHHSNQRHKNQPPSSPKHIDVKDFYPEQKKKELYFPPRKGRGRFGKFALLDSNKQWLVGVKSFNVPTRYYPIKLNDKIIAYIEREKNVRIIDRLDKMFSAKQNQAFLINTLVALCVSILVALFASYFFRKRILGLTHIAKELTSGHYEQRIAIKHNDEISQLSKDFNTLAETLQKNQQSQQQWIADISHELRTPITILKGELEALEDGIRPINMDAVQSLQQEINRLGKMIDDLYQLSISDIGALQYEKSEFVLYDLLNELFDKYLSSFNKHQINLSLLESNASQGLFYGDRLRLFQMFSKILDNSLSYTDTGGTVKIQLTETEHHYTVTIDDSAPSIDEQKLSQIFDRLYRVEESRNRSKGGAGLGLSIAKQIVSAHQGEITATTSCLGGLQIVCTLQKK